MNFKLRNLVAATLTGSFLMGFGATAMADSTTDIVNALVSKGVLTEEEGSLLTKGREMESAGQTKALKKASKLNVSDVIDNATVYGDIRVRAESRSGKEAVTGDKEDRTRGRYKVTLGVKTEAGDFYTDLALAMGAEGRSDNATFGKNNGSNTKEAVFIKRAMLGWKATDWLAIEAGRIKNPLYTTSMVWDGDLTFEGLAEKVNFKAGNADVFLTAVQSQYIGDRKDYSIATANNKYTNEVLAFQAGATMPIADGIKAKAAMTYTTYGSGGASTNFNPLVLGSTNTATNNLQTLEIPAEISFKLTDTLGAKVFGDYVVNLDSSARFDNAILASGASAAAVRAAGKDDKAWMLGAEIASKAGKKAQRGDWSTRLWYQEVGAYSLDQNAVDSDLIDSRVNMKGVIFKAGYSVQENVTLDFTGAHGSRKNDLLAAAGTASDISFKNLDSYDLFQLDVNYKF